MTRDGTELTATIIVADFESTCSHCHKPTLVSDTDRHDRVAGYGPPQRGCGARFTAITYATRRMSNQQRAVLAEMRPDLPIVEPH